MSLEEQILNDYKVAMKQGDKVKSSVLSFLRASLMNLAIAQSKNKLDDTDVISVIKKQIKRCQDSIKQFNAGGREDLVEKETRELKILEPYLPDQLSAQELEKIISEVISEIDARSIKDMGNVMKEVISRVADQADGKLVSELVKKQLISK